MSIKKIRKWFKQPSDTLTLDVIDFTISKHIIIFSTENSYELPHKSFLDYTNDSVLFGKDICRTIGVHKQYTYATNGISLQFQGDTWDFFMNPEHINITKEFLFSATQIGVKTFYVCDGYAYATDGTTYIMCKLVDVGYDSILKILSQIKDVIDRSNNPNNDFIKQTFNKTIQRKLETSLKSLPHNAVQCSANGTAIDAKSNVVGDIELPHFGHNYSVIIPSFKSFLKGVNVKTMMQMSYLAPIIMEGVIKRENIEVIRCVMPSRILY
jgi:hypothetical protein